MCDKLLIITSKIYIMSEVSFDRHFLYSAMVVLFENVKN